MNTDYVLVVELAQISSHGFLLACLNGNIFKSWAPASVVECEE